jgi:transposase-like protein
MPALNGMLDFMEMFSTAQKCSDYLLNARWGGKPQCPWCDAGRVYRFADGLRFKCAQCRRQFKATTGTIFEGSHLPLKKWMLAFYLVLTNRKGVSSYQVARYLGVGQPVAWKVMHKIRTAMKAKTWVRMTGVIECDEMMVGGIEKNKHKNKRTKNTRGRSLKTKSCVFGIVTRGGEVRTFPVRGMGASSLDPIIKANVSTLATAVYTDTWSGYRNVHLDYSHETINHKAKEYVRGDCHTNTIENYWSVFSRGLMGVYHHISRRYIGAYCDEFSFRYNTRKNSVAENIEALLRG